MNKSAKSLMVFFVLLLGLALNITVIHAQDKADPGNNEPYSPGLVAYRVGIYYQLKGDQQRAIAEFSQTIEELPWMGYAYAARGDSYAALGDYERAITDYSQAISIYPDYVSVLYTRARAYAALGETDLAVADYTNAIEQMPEYPNPYWGLGDVFFDAGQYPQALENYQTYLALVGDPPDAQVLQRSQMLRTATTRFS